MREKVRLTRVQFKPLPEEAATVVSAAGAQTKGWRDHIHHRDFKRFLAFTGVIFALLLTVQLIQRTQELIRDGKEAAEIAYHDLKGALDYLKKEDFKKADFLFKSAGEAFEEAERKVSYLSPQETPWKGGVAEEVMKLIGAGKSIARLGEKAALLMRDFMQMPGRWAEQKEGLLIELIKKQRALLPSIRQESGSVAEALRTISPLILPAEWRGETEEAGDELAQISSLIDKIHSDSGAVLQLLGDPLPHRYLVLFQNRYEIRATGGFMGSYALIDMNEGRVKKIDFKDIYATDGQLDRTLPPPRGLSGITKTYHMRDANYSPDFPSSAQKIMWFLEHSRGPSVDTVIAIDQSVIEELLKVTGPVPLGKWGIELEAENFSNLMSYLIESKVVSSSDPKEVLEEAIPRVKDRLMEPKNIKNILRRLPPLVASRHIQIYSADPEIESVWQWLKVDGRILPPQPDTDFLAPVSTSISGNKSDRFIQTDFEHFARVDGQGGVTDELTVRKKHTWKKNDAKPIDQLWKKFGSGKLDHETLLDILGRGSNVDYMRLYVPRGSRLNDIQGVDQSTVQVYDELGYTVFAFQWPALPAGQEAEVTVRYELPFRKKSGDDLAFIFQKQAGAEGHRLKKITEVDEVMRIEKVHPAPVSRQKTRVTQETGLSDNWFSVVALDSERK